LAGCAFSLEVSPDIFSDRFQIAGWMFSTSARALQLLDRHCDDVSFCLTYDQYLH
jgi:hypothetical protein